MPRRLLACCLLLAAAPAAGDWLITLEGRLIETRGPWTIDGRTLTYVDLEGEEHTLDLDDVDLEASEETTAIKAGKPWEPSEDGADESRKGKRRKGEKPRVILYATSLCSDCSLARELLETLGVDFIERDPYASLKALREYRKKAGRGGGLPVIDVDGHLIFSYNPRAIRQRVKELQEREAAEEEAEAEEPEDTG